jgi:anaerobic magnesium-protoporphyrin IX monomethyl ester cyclase
MRVVIAYPPIETSLGVPLLSQNRQFQYFNNPTFIYPVVPATAATVLTKSGYDVVWADGIAQRQTYSEFVTELASIEPDLVAIETKTPTVKKYWRIIDDLKAKFPQTKIVLMGDHVTALPEESLLNSHVDYVVRGGDFDLLLLGLVNHLSRGTELCGGVYFWSDGKIVNTGPMEQQRDLTDLPFIDRELTDWKLYAYKNGNFKYTPGTYTMVGRDCWWRKDGGCTFCSWTTTFPKFAVMKVERALDEVGHLIDVGVREVFDDTGTFPKGAWLRKFCQGMKTRGYVGKIRIGCNMRSDGLSEAEYAAMGEVGFRFILYGLESANQHSLDRLNKGTVWDDIKQATFWAKKAGLEPHVTCMVGYPWETYEEAKKTVDLTRELFERGWIDTLQATIVMPYPGTQLFSQAEQNGWLRTTDWDRYDMREPILKTSVPDEKILALTHDLYKSFLSPSFVARKLVSIRNKDDFDYIVRRGSQYVFGHLKDFSIRKRRREVVSTR